MILIATTADADALNSLVNGAYRGESSSQGWASEADLFDGTRTTTQAISDMISKTGYKVLKYVDNGRIEGCVELHTEDNRLYLGMLSVNPALQNSGIGKKLLHAAEEEAFNQGCSSIYMTVITQRHELLAWYIRHGYIDTGVRKPFDKSDPRHGIPKKTIELAVLEKSING